MAALLEQETAYPEIHRGEIIEGMVVGTDRDGILVDIGAKSEGVIPPQEMHCLQPEGASKLNHGDKVLVYVVQPESHEGQIILSLDRARGEQGWRVLQDYLDQNQGFDAPVTGSNKGGLLVNVEGVNAFVPLSQLVSGPERGTPENTQRALSEWVGRSITLKVIELNRRRNRAILSERAAVQERRAAEKERLLLELTEGDIKTGRIMSIREFGIFVDIGGADGLVHLSELSWERTPKSPHELFKVGEEVPVFVLKIDQESKKIALSVRRAQPERWEEIVSGYREGQIVPGQVTKLAPFGAFVRLEGPIEGLIHISELVDRRINHPREVVDEGDVVPVKIVRIEYDRHRLGLSLRQAREKSEEDDGWSFNDSGGVIVAPQEALDRLGITALPPKPARDDSDAGAQTTAVDESTVVAEQPVDAEPEDSTGATAIADEIPAAVAEPESALIETPEEAPAEEDAEPVVAADEQPEADASAEEPSAEDEAAAPAPAELEATLIETPEEATPEVDAEPVVAADAPPQVDDTTLEATEPADEVPEEPQLNQEEEPVAVAEPDQPEVHEAALESPAEASEEPEAAVEAPIETAPADVPEVEDTVVEVTEVVTEIEAAEEQAEAVEEQAEAVEESAVEAEPTVDIQEETQADSDTDVTDEPSGTLNKVEDS